MSAVVIAFPGTGRPVLTTAPIGAVSHPTLSDVDVAEAEFDVGRMSTGMLLPEAHACLSVARTVPGTAECLVWQLRAMLCLTRALDVAHPHGFAAARVQA